MSTQSEQVIQTALSLSEADRARLAALLIRSLESEGDNSDVDAAWAAEIPRRILSIDSGEVQLVPWDDVMRRMHNGRNG